jgi:hypothetical protein
MVTTAFTTGWMIVAKRACYHRDTILLLRKHRNTTQLPHKPFLVLSRVAR